MHRVVHEPELHVAGPELLAEGRPQGPVELLGIDGTEGAAHAENAL
ncbi:hypothetical protein KDK95_33135 [Actinospica sp. MGRD01-02]|uniref:Uncharacterized protein n=1 Tax=Actinospica acidithermotolerans TaxID=2828514 RepID=A0A941EIU4_9ACTN|nr:hypothetical protein [Actinospica acidithermotolerans]MBR7831198.1 hypothetical protein [Actinospica acidithermotolerans]